MRPQARVRKMRPHRKDRAAARSTDDPREMFHDPAIRAARKAAQAQNRER